MFHPKLVQLPTSLLAVATAFIQAGGKIVYCSVLGFMLIVITASKVLLWRSQDKFALLAVTEVDRLLCVYIYFFFVLDISV